MIRKVMATLVVCLLWSGVASADIIKVPPGSGYCDLTSGPGIGWEVELNEGTGIYSYLYNPGSTGDESELDSLFLETSEIFTTGNVDSYFFTFSEGITVSGPKTWPTEGLYGLKWEKVGTPQTSFPTVTFTSIAGPVWGDVWAKNNNYYQNKGFGTDPISGETDFANWIPTPGPWNSAGVLIPEPGMSVLALAALVAGAFARRRRRKEE